MCLWNPFCFGNKFICNPKIPHIRDEGESFSVVSDSATYGLYSPWNSPGQNTGVGSLSLLQGIFPTQGSNQGLLYCRKILYQLSYKGRWRILEWVAYPFSSGSSQPRNQTEVSCIAGGFFTNWAIREAYKRYHLIYVFLCLTSFSKIIFRSNMLLQMAVSFFFMAEEYCIVYMCHIFFIHLSANRHIGCFHDLVIVNSAANTGNLTMISSPWVVRNSGIEEHAHFPDGAGRKEPSCWKATAFLQGVK